MKGEKLQAILKMLRICRGQVEGIIGMVESERRVLDISNQIMATRSLLNCVQGKLLGECITACARRAIRDPEQADASLREIDAALEKLLPP